METAVPDTATGGLAGLFVEHRAGLLRFLTARCGSAGDAEDLLHELWIRVRTLESGPVVNGRAYLFRMANNLALDQARQRNRAMARDHSWLAAEGFAEVDVSDRSDPTLPADEVIARRQEAMLLLAAIAALPPGAQRALRLHRLEGLSQAEVAARLGISRSGVEKHLALAMKQLRNSLVNCGWRTTGTSEDQTPVGKRLPPDKERP